MNIVIGVDVGGSHITSAAIDLNTLKIISNSTYTNKINNKASKDNILKSWSSVINQTIKSIPEVDNIKIGFAMPGPFQYATGLAMFENNDKYENLYNVSIPNELPKYLDCSNVELRFLNDASSFGVGVSCMGKAKNYKKVIAITLGTGFGSSFISKGIPKVTSKDVPEGGCLWDKQFKEGMADDYFSTRWFVKRYLEVSRDQVKGVKEVVQTNNKHSKKVFEEFSNNFVDFMTPFIENYQPDLIVLGGNISNASNFFLSDIEQKLKTNGLTPVFTVSTLMEEAALIGSARLFSTSFWNNVKNDLPNF
ncbi:MAG: transcriptional regulator [Lutibacter sp.]|nr:MAG: transcriptional regulator [Lutibacter sp.]